VSTEDTPERPQNVFTEEPAISEAKASPSAPGDDPGQTSDDSDPPPRKKRKHRDRPAERRISKLSEQLEASNATNAELTARLDALEAKPPAAKPEPKLRDFQTPREYADAVAAWVKDSTPAAKPKPKAKPTENSKLTEARKQFAVDGNKRLGDTFQDAFTADDLAINQTMGEFMLDSDLGPELLVYLHTHQDEARAIWFDKPEEANKRLEAIEDTLDSGKPEPKIDDDGKPARGKDGKFVKEPDPEPKTRTSKSNAPAAPSDSERGEVVPSTDLEKAPMDDYSRTRRKQYRDRGERY
jgi:hypothetical protein